MEASVITLVLGPTNTGKTHRAIERMLEYPSGMIGLPLRLLAREVYDRITAKLGEREVALVTGEERRVPKGARYWVCTVEAMPTSREVDFVAVDEIQLVSHPERGHVFTERLLHARGKHETWFMGSEPVRRLAEILAPTARVRTYPRLSALRSFGVSSLAALPPRSVVVAFSAPRVYEVAERLRERRGGAAVVLGALSPRARNAQVALYQAGEVDYLVATDAIGMGLNLDVEHVAFADLRKFDGKESRPLEPAELGQIAGRAGRYLTDGTFGVLSPLESLPEGTTRAIELHSFPRQELAFYRNSDLDLASVERLLESLALPPRLRILRRPARADDTSALAALLTDDEVKARVRTPDGVKLLWSVCQIPNFRGLWVEEHVRLLTDVFLELCGPSGGLGSDWFGTRVERLDDVRGDIETLLARMASIRSFTYISHHERWVPDAARWQEHTRDIEDRLSDALHERLVARFVERGASRRGRPATSRGARRSLPASDDRAPASDHPFSSLMALRDRLARAAAPSAASDPSGVEELVDAPHARFVLDDEGRIRDGERVLGRLTRGTELLLPEVQVLLPELGSGARSQLQRRLVAWARDLVGELLEPLRHPSVRELSPAARGLVYQLEHGLGTVLAEDASEQLRGLTAEDRDALERLGVRAGALVVYVPRLVEPRALAVRAILYRTFHGSLPRCFGQGASFALSGAGDPAAYTALGYPGVGPRALRADLVERVAALLDSASASGPFTPPAELQEWLGATPSESSAIVRAFGYRDGGRGTFVRPSRRKRRRRRRARKTAE